MAVDLSTLTDYSWSDIKKAAKAAMVNAAVGGNRLVINGRDITRITPEQAQKLYQYASQMDDAESGTADASGIALIEFNDPV
jgi:cytidylate kinase